jgi:antitoxin ParD1/3/4
MGVPTPHYDRFVEERIAEGQYQNASELLRAGLRLLEQQTREGEKKLAMLRELAAGAFESLDHGHGFAVENKRELKDLLRHVGRRAAKGTAKRRGGE